MPRGGRPPSNVKHYGQRDKQPHIKNIFRWFEKIRNGKYYHSGTKWRTIQHLNVMKMSKCRDNSYICVVSTCATLDELRWTQKITSQTNGPFDNEQIAHTENKIRERKCFRKTAEHSFIHIKSFDDEKQTAGLIFVVFFFIIIIFFFSQAANKTSNEVNPKPKLYCYAKNVAGVRRLNTHFLQTLSFSMENTWMTKKKRLFRLYFFYFLFCIIYCQFVRVSRV